MQVRGLHDLASDNHVRSVLGPSRACLPGFSTVGDSLNLLATSFLLLKRWEGQWGYYELLCRLRILCEWTAFCPSLLGKRYSKSVDFWAHLFHKLDPVSVHLFLAIVIILSINYLTPFHYNQSSLSKSSLPKPGHLSFIIYLTHSLRDCYWPLVKCTPLY